MSIVSSKVPVRMIRTLASFHSPAVSSAAAIVASGPTPPAAVSISFPFASIP